MLYILLIAATVVILKLMSRLASLKFKLDWSESARRHWQEKVTLYRERYEKSLADDTAEQAKLTREIASLTARCNSALAALRERDEELGFLRISLTKTEEQAGCLADENRHLTEVRDEAMADAALAQQMLEAVRKKVKQSRAIYGKSKRRKAA